MDTMFEEDQIGGWEDGKITKGCDEGFPNAIASVRIKRFSKRRVDGRGRRSGLAYFVFVPAFSLRELLLVIPGKGRGVCFQSDGFWLPLLD